jgi:hypothetical protein
MRVYHLRRDEDVSGSRGCGRVAQVSEFDDGTAVLHWNRGANHSGVTSTEVFDDIANSRSSSRCFSGLTCYRQPAYGLVAESSTQQCSRVPCRRGPPREASFCPCPRETVLFRRQAGEQDAYHPLDESCK